LLLWLLLLWANLDERNVPAAYTTEWNSFNGKQHDKTTQHPSLRPRTSQQGHQGIPSTTTPAEQQQQSGTQQH